MFKLNRGSPRIPLRQLIPLLNLLLRPLPSLRQSLKQMPRPRSLAIVPTKESTYLSKQPQPQPRARVGPQDWQVWAL